MNKYAILIEGQRACLLKASFDRATLTVNGFTQFKFPENKDGGRPCKLDGASLARHLKGLGWRVKSAQFLMATPDLLHQCLELPPTEARELHDVVKLQIESNLFLNQDDVQFDYAVQGTDETSTNALVGISNEQQIQPYREIASDSGIQVAGLGSKALSTVTFLRKYHPEICNEQLLVVSANESSIDCIAIDGSTIIGVHSRDFADSSSELSRDETSVVIQQETARFFGAMRNRHADFVPSRVLSLLDDASFRSDLTARFDLEGLIEFEAVTCMAAFAQKTSSKNFEAIEKFPAEFAALAGLLINENEPRQNQMDLIHPKRSKNKIMLPIGMGVTAAILCIAVLVVGFQYLQSRKEKLNKQLAVLNTEFRNLESENRKQDSFIQKAAFVNGWEQRRVNWLEELSELQEYLPDRKRAYLRQLEFRLPESMDPPSTIATGYAKSQTDIMSMNARLSSEQSPFDLQPKPFSTDQQSAPFGNQFELDLQKKPAVGGEARRVPDTDSR
ncbi:MAG: hypothetical protein ACPGLY_23580 [Rubripirellula sp.]